MSPGNSGVVEVGRAQTGSRMSAKAKEQGYDPIVLEARFGPGSG